VINERYEQAAIVLTSNCDRSEWPGLFGEPLLASAALDRLTHGAHFVEITGPSFRAKQTKKRLATPRPEKSAN
jgi:DNA replication protein DnaC